MRGRGIDRVGIAIFVIAILLLSGNPVGIRFSNRELAPFWGGVLRLAVACALLFSFVAIRGIALPRGRALVGAAIVGLGQYVLTFALIYWALVAIPAGMASVLLATVPMWTLFVSAIAGFERITPISLVGAFLAIVGIAIAFADQVTYELPLVRVAAILIAALSGASTAVLLKKFPRTHPVATNAIGALIGTVLLASLSRLIGEPWVVPQETTTWLALAYLVVCTTVGLVLLTFVMIRWTPSVAGYGAVITPMLTVLIARQLAGETFGLGFFLGAAIVGAGVYVGAIAGVSPAVRELEAEARV